ncbi:MAG: PIN domain-containing protein [Oscillospiraceae bacterium]|jgi:predicted nucleic acid-binding protein|nr:PIN domain-containing protein [Oscillospiraceae bacterium]
MKALIDTNVILDALLAREPFYEAAADLLLAIAEEKCEGFITASSFTDLHYLIRRSLKDSEKTREILLGLIAVVGILDVTGIDCEKAFDLPMPDFEDALQATCAKRNKMDCIITRNEKHFSASPVLAISPGAFLGRLS